jgi:secreted PhoX family phosphatase
MGRFRHEAIAVDPVTGIVYLTEDRNDGVIYRFIPKVKGELARGGRLQALKIAKKGKFDSRNWPGNKSTFPLVERLPVEWIDLDNVESPADDLRIQALQKGALIFSRAEGMWYGSADVVGEDSIYFACTDGGEAHLGQIFRYFPGPNEGAGNESEAPGHIELYLEPNDTALLKNADNITISPSGHLFICEDTKKANHIRGVSENGEMFTLARNRLNDSELAGVCVSPDGSTVYVNIQSPGITLAIRGPFV